MPGTTLSALHGFTRNRKNDYKVGTVILILYGGHVGTEMLGNLPKATRLVIAGARAFNPGSMNNVPLTSKTTNSTVPPGVVTHAKADIFLS